MGGGSLNEDRLPTTVRGLAAVSGFNDAASEMVYPLLPAFIVGTLGGSAATLGALDGASDLAASLLRLLSGKYADQKARRGPLVLFGYGLAIAVRPVIALAQSAGVVIGLRVIDRIGKGIRSPARDAMISDAVGPETRGRAFGFQRAFDHGGAVIGSLLAFGLVEWAGLGPRQVIGWSVVPGLLALVMLMATLKQGARSEDRGARPVRAASPSRSIRTPQSATLHRSASSGFRWSPSCWCSSPASPRPCCSCTSNGAVWRWD